MGFTKIICIVRGVPRSNNGTPTQTNTWSFLTILSSWACARLSAVPPMGNSLWKSAAAQPSLGATWSADLAEVPRNVKLRIYWSQY